MNSNILDNYFLSYDKILDKLKKNNITTKNNMEITHKDLRKAISTMQKYHSKCRWKSERVKSKRHYILIEGYYWLVYVYFQKDKKIIDADIEFLLMRIEQYEKLLSISRKELFVEDIFQSDLEKFFNRSRRTIESAISKMITYNSNYRYIKDNRYIISKEGIKWLCENCLKQKYIEILENYKMELTEKYIQAGYPYDNFFGLN